MRADARNLSTAPADLTPPGGPGLAPAEGGLLEESVEIAVAVADARAPSRGLVGSFWVSFGGQ